MTIKGIMQVVTRPASPEDAAAYHEWYETTHIPEILATPGMVRARRYENPDGSFLAIYEVDVDIEQAQANMAAAREKNTPPVGVCMDPPPAVTWMPARYELEAGS
jgi:hypothetical protein